MPACYEGPAAHFFLNVNFLFMWKVDSSFFILITDSSGHTCFVRCWKEKNKRRKRKEGTKKKVLSPLLILSLIFLINFFTSAALAGAGQFQKLLITNP